MKYVIQVLILFCVLHATGQVQPTTTTQATFGRYGGKDQPCLSGRGLCSFSVTNGHSNNTILSKKIDETTFALQVSRTVVSSEDEIQILGKKISEIKENESMAFVQSEDLYLENNTLQKLNIDPRYNKITSGNYSIHISKEHIEILFTLKVAQ